MTYLVNDNCIKCKHMDCVSVCPVDCFYEGENMLVINPDEAFSSPDEAIRWEEINREYSLIWPVITQVRPEDVPTDAAEWDNVPNKFEDHFNPAPGKGD